MLGQGPGFLLLQAALRGQDSRCIPIAFLGCLGGEGCSICYCAPISPATPGPPPAPHTQQPCNSCLHQRPEGSFRSTNRSMALLCENPEWLPAMVWLPMSLAGPGPASTCSLILHPSLPARCSLYTLALIIPQSHQAGPALQPVPSSVHSGTPGHFALHVSHVAMSLACVWSSHSVHVVVLSVQCSSIMVGTQLTLYQQMIGLIC